ncbi:hypothetical protein U1Q18_017138 [Sarracenia purpurea var. burkii]
MSVRKEKKKGIAGVFLFLFAEEKNDWSKCGSAKVSFWVTGLVGSTGIPWSDRNKEETRSGFQVKHGEDDSGDPVQAVLCSTKSGSCRGRDGDFGRPAEDLVQRLKISVHQFRRFESKEISEFFFGRADCRRRRCRGEKSGIFAGGKFVWIRAIIQCVARVDFPIGFLDYVSSGNQLKLIWAIIRCCTKEIGIKQSWPMWIENCLERESR